MDKDQDPIFVENEDLEIPKTGGDEMVEIGDDEITGLEDFDENEFDDEDLADEEAVDDLLDEIEEGMNDEGNLDKTPSYEYSKKILAKFDKNEGNFLAQGIE